MEGFNCKRRKLIRVVFIVLQNAFAISSFGDKGSRLLVSYDITSQEFGILLLRVRTLKLGLAEEV